MIFKNIDDIANDIEEKIIGYRRDFHKYPELGWTEFRTASLIARKLFELGYEVKLGKNIIDINTRMNVPSQEILNANYERALNQGADKELIKYLKNGFTGVVGILKNGNGPVIALRFDIDALNILEDSNVNHVPYKKGFSSVNKNIMHACGHDGHAAIGLGTAEILAKTKDYINGTVKLIFQPAEEEVRGAKSIVATGILDDVDYLISGHIGLKANRSGEVMCCTKGFLATSKINATFIGKCSHAGATPELGNNALLAAATAVLNIHSIPRNSNGITRVNVGKLNSGTARNIIPDKAYLEIETRGETSELNKYMRNYVEKILNNSAEMHNSKVIINCVGEAESAESNIELAVKIKNVASNIYNIKSVYDEEINFGASEDITYMMNKVKENGGKSAYIMFGSDITSAHHSSTFDFNEKDLLNAVKLYSNLILNIF